MVTLPQVAKASGYSLATVSYALRNDRRISAKTRDAIRAVARELGYRPNPHFSSLMAHIRSGRPVTSGERIGFVWVRTSRKESESDPFLANVYEGARLRAEALGYRLEPFWTDDPNMTDRRLSNILKARGITGVLLSPVLHQSEASIDFEWDNFSPAVIGSTRWTPELHHSGHHHYLAMQLALGKLAESGRRQSVAVIESEVNERARRAWQAAFLTHQTASAAKRILIVDADDPATVLVRRIAAVESDAILVSNVALLDRLRIRKTSRTTRRIVTLHWQPTHPEIDGIDQCYDMIAANAVDLVVSQLMSGERGVPALPRMVLFPGRWVEQQAGGIASSREAKSTSPGKGPGSFR